MKKILSVILCLVIGLTFISCSKSTEPTTETTDTTQAEAANESTTFDSTIQPLPSGYTDKVSGVTSRTEGFEYTHNGHTKKAVVYLPPDYDENTEYDILYIMPGASGTHASTFGESGDESDFKNLLDNMITNRDIKPLIAVTADYYDSDNYDMDDERLDYLQKDFREEIETIIMPTVEGKYSTYAKGTNKEDLIASREHRAFAGTSMGGATCWNMLAFDTEYFYYYAPTAAGGYEDYYETAPSVGETLRQHLSKIDESSRDFFVFGTDGTKDVTYDKMEALIARLKSDYTDIFTFTDSDKSKGNITYKVMEGGEHNMATMYIYLYNALKAFFPY